MGMGCPNDSLQLVYRFAHAHEGRPDLVFLDMRRITRSFSVSKACPLLERTV